MPFLPIFYWFLVGLVALIVVVIYVMVGYGKVRKIADVADEEIQRRRTELLWATLIGIFYLLFGLYWVFGRRM